MPGAIVEGRNEAADRTLTPDFCIVGSGAGGGVLALKLAEAGFEVAVLEEGPSVPKGQGHGGPAHVRPTLVERESRMYRQLYQEGGGRLTSDGRILVMQGRCLGGGTTVNWSACLPPPDETLDFWQSRHGLPFTPGLLRPYIQEVVNYLGIHRDEKYNRSARALQDGARALGYHSDNLPNNTRRCRECGSCGTGCPFDRKQSGVVTWLQDAVSPAAVPGSVPATVFCDTQVHRLVPERDRIVEVQARFLAGKTRPTGRKLTVRPTRGVILAAGAIGTPAILLRSNLGRGGLVGRRTHIHPITMCFGRYDEPTFAAYGVPDNGMSRQFAAGPTGYLVETGSFFPVMSSIASLDFGASLRRFLGEYYPQGAILYAHHNSGFEEGRAYGTVRLDRQGDPELEYDLSPRNMVAMRRSLVEMSRIHLAAGAKSVYHITNPAVEIRSDADLGRLNDISFEPARTTVMTVHVMGGCRMGADERNSVVGTDFRLRDFRNVWVTDASVFPTGLGANPQVTIYALALWAAREICRVHGREDRFVLRHQADAWPW